MGRIRTIKPEFTMDEELSALPAEIHLLAAGLLCYADDEGYFNANPALVKAAIFPLRECSMTIHGMLTELSRIGFIELTEQSRGKRWGRIVKFAVHQRVNRPSPSKIKDLWLLTDDSLNSQPSLTDDSLPEGKGKEVGKERKGSNPPTPPTPNPYPSEEIPEGLTAMQYAKGIFELCRIPGNGSYKLQVKLADSIGFLAEEESCELHVAAKRLLDRLQSAGKDVKLWFWLEDRKFLATGDVYEQFLAKEAD